MRTVLFPRFSQRFRGVAFLRVVGAYLDAGESRPNLDSLDPI